MIRYPWDRAVEQGRWRFGAEETNGWIQGHRPGSKQKPTGSIAARCPANSCNAYYRVDLGDQRGDRRSQSLRGGVGGDLKSRLTQSDDALLYVDHGMLLFVL